MKWQKFAFPVFVLLMMALPALPIPDFWITQLNYIGL
jgi:branched-chain amino acid transport system permease protein